MCRSRRIPIVVYGNVDPAMGEYGADPPQHHDHSHCLHSKPERRGNEDAVEENYHGGLGQKKKCGALGLGVKIYRNICDFHYSSCIRAIYPHR